MYVRTHIFEKHVCTSFQAFIFLLFGSSPLCYTNIVITGSTQSATDFIAAH